MNEPDPHVEIQGEPTDIMPARPPGFWRRPAAILVDWLILGCVGFALGELFFDPVTRLGAWGRLIGFVIALVYFGCLNSQLGGGQTLGKRMLRIRVVRLDGRPLELSRSVLRFIIVAVPFFLNGLSLPVSRTPRAVINILSFLIFGVGGAIVYLYLFNRGTRRSLHDLLAGSAVVSSASGEVPAGRLWKGHIAIFGVLGVLFALAGFIFADWLSTRYNLAGLMQLLASVERSEEVRTANVFSGTVFGSGGRAQHLQMTVMLNGRPDSFDDVANEMAAIVMRDYPEFVTKDRVGINLVYGYDLGIARRSWSMNTVLSPDEWKERVSRSHQPEDL